MIRQAVYVAGYPKTGTTWLTWLLADVLDSPAGGSMPKEDRKELATEGQDRPGPYVVRKGHFVLMEGDFSIAVPTPHRMAPTAITNEKVAWIVRDPRDVAISARHYWGGWQTISELLGHMGKGTGPFRSFGPFNQFVTAWLDFSRATMVKYEDLIEQPLIEIKRLLANMDLDIPDDGKILGAIERQSFDRKKAEMKSRKRPNAHLGRILLRVGRPEQWKYNFSSADCQQAAQLFNPLMIRLGYIEHNEWWKQHA
jgi:hypothetical protein